MNKAYKILCSSIPSFIVQDASFIIQHSSFFIHRSSFSIHRSSFMLKVGLTGSIAVGKTFVVSVLAELGCMTFDADKIAHAVMEPGHPAYEDIVSEFGEGVLAPNGPIDRQKLGVLVFGDEARRKRLNEIVHPRVIEEQNRLLRAAEAANPGRHRHYRCGVDDRVWRLQTLRQAHSRPLRARDPNGAFDAPQPDHSRRRRAKSRRADVFSRKAPLRGLRHKYGWYI